MRKFRFITIAVACLCAFHGMNASERTLPSEASAGLVQNTFMLTVGSAHRADTYLTPLHYDGWIGGVGYTHRRAFRSRPLVWNLDVSLDLDRTMNRVRNSAMLGARFEARWSLLDRMRLCDNVEIGVGGATTLDAGALYLSRNGNNPVAANASWTVDVAAYASARFRIGRLPVTAMYRATLPVVGAMFAPDYGQLYYEIYLGDSKNIFTGAYWGRYFRLDQQVTVDLAFRNGKSLKLGYGADILSTKVKGIVSRRINHTFILGLTVGWFSYTPKKAEK